MCKMECYRNCCLAATSVKPAKSVEHLMKSPAWSMEVNF